MSACALLSTLLNDMHARTCVPMHCRLSMLPTHCRQRDMVWALRRALVDRGMGMCVAFVCGPETVCRAMAALAQVGGCADVALLPCSSLLCVTRTPDVRR